MVDQDVATYFFLVNSVCINYESSEQTVHTVMQRPLMWTTSLGTAVPKWEKTGRCRLSARADQSTFMRTKPSSKKWKQLLHSGFNSQWIPTRKCLESWVPTQCITSCPTKAISSRLFMQKISKSMLNRPTQEDEATSLPEMPSAELATRYICSKNYHRKC